MNLSFVKELANSHKDYIISMKNHFHENPELSFKEHNTSKRICEELEAMGIPYAKTSETGLVAHIGKKGGKNVALRADIDALPMAETSDNLCCDKVAVSKNEGISHTCGHDGHIAMLLGAAKVLKGMENELEGMVYLIFEDGEEVNIGLNDGGCKGAQSIMKYLSDVEIHSIYGIHLYAGMKSGTVSVQEGPRMAGIYRFEVEIEGKGGHGSRPDQAISPLFAASYTMTNLANSWVNEIDVTKTVTLGMGYLNSGSKFNIIPNTATFGGSLRFFDKEEGEKAAKVVERIIRMSVEMHRCKVTDYDFGFMDSVVNDPACSKRATDVCNDILGKDNVLTVDPWFGSESYNYYLKEWPGVLALLGIQNDEKGTGALHHNPKFDVDNDVLPTGSATLAAYAISVVNEK